MGVVMQSGKVLMRGGKAVAGCGGCPTMPFLIQAQGDVDVSAFVFGNLTWSATAVGGVSPGWRYFLLGGLPVCSAGAGPSVAIREIVFWCDGNTWQASMAVLFNGIQDSYSTIGGTLDPFTVFNPGLNIITQTHGEGLVVCDIGSGHITLIVTIYP